LGVGTVLGDTRASSSLGSNLETSSLEVADVFRIKLSSTDEGKDIGGIFDVGENKLSWVRETRAVDIVVARISIKVISVVVPLVVAELDDIITLNDPDEFLNRVVEVEFYLNVGVNSRFIAGKLELFDEVLVGSLGETATFIGIKVDVVNEKGGVFEGRNAESIKGAIDRDTTAV